MSLVGNLEDLGLGDILQIVSLSRKSGVLSLQNRAREGKIVFLHGQVIRATSTLFRENLGDLLLRRRLVDVETLKKALYIQRTTDPPPRIGTILAERFGVPADTVEEIVREQVEKIVYSFFGWPEGTFSFELGEPADLATTSFNPLQFMLDQGLNPQWLSMEGSRIVDEKRHRGESLDAHGEEPLLDLGGLLDPPEDGTAAVAKGKGEGSRPVIFLIDDDVVTRERLGRLLQDRGFSVKLFEHAADLLRALTSADAKSTPAFVIVDLIMPRPDGSGIFGGLDLLENIRQRFPEITTLVLSDYPNPEIERRVRHLGVPAVVPKPKKTDIREERGIQALESLADTLIDLLPGGSGKEERLPDASLFNLGAELLREIGEPAPAEPGRVKESPGLHLLRGMLQELSNPSLGGGIILLVLRFASEFMNRAVIFLVKERDIIGLGQFGIDMGEEMADVRVRRMKIPIDAPSIFGRILREMAPLKIRMGNEEWDHYLREQLGGKEPLEVFLGPVVSEGKIVAVLYGDNLPEFKAIGDTEALEIFLSQAGLAMEKALLERRLRGREAI